MEFSRMELVSVATALVLQEKSVQRLAAKEGQPESVAAEYRKVGVVIGDLIKKVNAEIVAMDSKAKK